MSSSNCTSTYTSTQRFSQQALQRLISRSTVELLLNKNEELAETDAFELADVRRDLASGDAPNVVVAAPACETLLGLRSAVKPTKADGGLRTGELVTVVLDVELETEQKLNCF